jgi:hypothetical protein
VKLLGSVDFWISGKLDFCRFSEDFPKGTEQQPRAPEFHASEIIFLPY